MQSFTFSDSACQWDTFAKIWGFLAIKAMTKVPRLGTMDGQMKMTNVFITTRYRTNT